MVVPVGYLAYRLSLDEPRNYHPHSKVTVKRGAEILDGPYPQSFTDFIGQERARLQIIAAVTSSIQRGEPMDHMLLASGYPGIGKTALARLTANLRGVGFVELGGSVSDRDAGAAIAAMEEGDVLFLDEIHRLVFGGKARAEWLLTLLQDGALHTPQGVVPSPGITVIAATTDAQKLPETILDRFVIKPVLEPYTAAEARQIAELSARRLGFGGEHLPMPATTGWLEKVARACDNNPRRMGHLLSIVRDIAVSSDLESLSEDGYDISLALEWAGLTEDGLTLPMQNYLVALWAYGGKAGINTIRAAINETEVSHTEKALIQRGYVQIATGGRELTPYGAVRAEELARAQHAEMVQREEQS